MKNHSIQISVLMSMGIVVLALSNILLTHTGDKTFYCTISCDQYTDIVVLALLNTCLLILVKKHTNALSVLISIGIVVLALLNTCLFILVKKPTIVLSVLISTA